MKNITLLLMLLSLKFVAQNHAFKINPIGFFNNGIEGSYENYIGNNQSIEIVVGLATLNRFGNNNDVNILGIEARYKFFLNKKDTFKGLYLTPVGTLIRTSEDNSKRYTILGLGGLVGYQFMLGQKNQTSGFIFDLNLGLSNYFSSANSNPNVNNISGLQTRFGASLGYAF